MLIPVHGVGEVIQGTVIGAEGNFETQAADYGIPRLGKLVLPAKRFFFC